MKKIFYTAIFLIVASFSANAQSKIMEQKQQYNFMLRMHSSQNLNKQDQRFKIKVNPYWQDIDAPHTYNSYMPQINVPCFNAVWGVIKYDSSYPEKHFLRTADGGKTWRYDTIQAPAGYDLANIYAINANVCYATMNKIDFVYNLGGGIFKTIDGGASWKQIGAGKLFDENSFPDFIYFFDDKNGITVGDNNGDTSRLEIYTTCDAGKTWHRVLNKNIPPTLGSAYSLVFNAYTAYKNRFWFKAFDSQGNQYLYRSDDLGHHWQLFPFNVPEFGFDFAFEDKQNGLAVGFPFDSNQSFEAVTHDGGKTWTQKTDFTGYVMGGFVTVIPYTHVYVSTLPGFTPVYGSSYSRDGGKSWKLIDIGVDAHHSAVAFLNPFVGWTGRAETEDINGGAYKWKLHFSLENNNVITDNDADASSISKDNLTNTINASLFPNPANNVIKIQGLNASAKTTISLYNISGKLIQQATTNGESYQFNIQKLAAGSYYIKVESGAKTATLKFVKE